MDVTKRNLIVGLAGIAILMISVLVYAQFNAARNFDLEEFQRTNDVVNR
jgi:hypothetical protein